MTCHHLNTTASKRSAERPAQHRKMPRLAALAATGFFLACASLAAAPAASAAPPLPSSAADESPAGEESLITLLTEGTDPAAVTASPNADLDFDREYMTSTRSPEHQLIKVLSGRTGGSRTDALALPLKTVVPSSPYGTRVSPITGNPAEFHTGQDFASPCGSPVLSSAAGTVTYAKWHPGGGGWRIEVTHQGGLKTTYNHLASFAVAEGRTVERGDLIAYAGTTGASTGCHLHFEVWLGGKLTDPAPWL